MSHKPPRPLGLAAVFAFGAIVGSFFDGFHTYGGMTAYSNPVLFRMAWWTMPLFGGAAVLSAMTYGSLRRSDEEPPSGARLGLGFAAFGLLYFATGFLPAGHGVKLALLVVSFALLVRYADSSRAALRTGLVAAFVGPAFEIVLVHFGAFSHLEPDIGGLPIWLPGLYAVSGPGFAPLAYRLMRLRFAPAPRAAVGRIA